MQLGEFNVLHEFVVLKTLVVPVILGSDFLQGNGQVLDFTQNPVTIVNKLSKVTSPTENSMEIVQIVSIYEAT